MSDYLTDKESISLQKEVRRLRASNTLWLVLFFISHIIWFVAWILAVS